jgi:polysaccharide deacetylase family protein (PEP-CTERM system associated)
MTERGSPAVASVGDLANIDPDSSAATLESPAWPSKAVILSVDVEEHFRIEAAAGLSVGAAQRASYREGLERSTRWLLELFEERRIKATFFVLGHLARDFPDLVRSIHGAGHEIASHGWGHERLHRLTPATFREDVTNSKQALEDLTGQEVLGYRAPTFSVVRRTAWAIDVLAELGFLYDSSIYPVRHDRYGVPDAPRSSYLVEGPSNSLLEIPPLTWRLPGVNLPAAGGGYFRLFPPFVMERAIRQAWHSGSHPAAMLYFHPWEFDPDQPKLPLGRLSRFRTYVGIKTSRGRLEALLKRHQFTQAATVARRLDLDRRSLTRFRLAE